MSGRGEVELGRFVPAAVAAVTLIVAVPVGVLRGGASVVLWLAFAALAVAVLLFWESLRSLVDPSAPTEEDHDESARLASLEARKHAALRALKDIAFERSIGRLGEADHAALEARYRAEAKAAMAEIDEGVSAWRDAAEALIDAAERRALGVEAPPATRADDEAPPVDDAHAAPVEHATRTCDACGTRNDPDAAFCKRCGARVAEEENHALA